jgi:cytochrome b subunit of formate dehydrogenase
METQSVMEILRNIFAFIGIVCTVSVIGGYLMYRAEMKCRLTFEEDEHSKHVIG